MLITTLVGVLIALIFYKLRKTYNYWRDNGIMQIEPMPLFGNFGGFIFRKRSFPETFQHLYQHFPDERYVGVYQFLDPLLMIRDPELIKEITVKNFDSFSEHKTFMSEEIDPFWGKNLFQMTSGKWRGMRPVLSPAFTGSKMRAMFVLMKECSERFVDYFLNDKSETIEIEMKDVSTRFTNDAFATTAFGVDCDSLTNRNNEFYLMGKEMTDFSGLSSLKFMAYTFSPLLCKLFNVTIFNERVKRFFTDIVLTTIKLRKEEGIIRPDMIHLLMEAQAGRLKHEQNENSIKEFSSVDESYVENDAKQIITDIDIVAQAFFFFFAGFDAVSTVVCYLAYELAIHPEIQDRLRQEIDETSAKCDGQITYDALLAMKYLDMVVSETLRKWGAAVADRKCLKPFTIKAERPNEKDVTIQPGDIIFFTMFSMQRDPKYFPDPEKFDPERFSDENKHKIAPFTYMPFGVGPRNCIGSRFALMEIKVLFYHILKSFEIVRTERTPVPIVFKKAVFNFSVEGGFWVGLKKRN